MHCASALLYNRKLSSFDKLGAAETKLLYTLHWIILDATEECSDAELEQGIKRPFDHYLLPITTLELFVYLFAPLTSYLKGSDFLSCFRLENGYKIWEAIFQFRHPDIPSFVAVAKPKKDIFSGQHFEKKTAAKFGDVFMGGSSDKEKEDSLAQDLGLVPPPVASATPSASPALTPCVETKSLVKDPLTPQISFERRSSKTTPDSASPDSKQKMTPTFKRLKDPVMATYFDVAVLRCLFLSQWIEEGVDWALKFVINRLNDVKEAQAIVARPVHRCKSLPNLKCDFKRRTTTYLDEDSDHLTLAIDTELPVESDASRRESIETSSLPGDQLKQKKHQKKKRSKKKASCDSLSHTESKVETSVKGKRLKKHDWKVLRKALIFSSHETLPPPPRPGSSLGIGTDDGDRKSRKEALDQKIVTEKNELCRGKSMPSLHLLDRRSSSSDTPPSKPIETETLDDSDSSSALKKLALPPSVPKPIITITEHSPVASMQFFANHEDDGTCVHKRSKMVRCKSDKNISYFTAVNPEAAGSTHYIAKEGHFSLTAVLKAVHSVSGRESTSSLRTCEACVKIIRLLLDMDMLKRFDMGRILADEEEQSKRRKDKQKEPEEWSIHNLFVDTLMSVVKRLGCPNGCNEGFHGPNADKLRKEIRDILLILFNANEEQFVIYFQNLVTNRCLQELLDYFHAFVGFCTDVTAPLSLAKKVPISAASPSESTETSIVRTPYATNFGAGYGRIGSRGVESVIFDKIFKCLVTRSMKMQKELKMQLNLSQYCELRQLLTYVRDAHGGIFRKVLLSALFDTTEKLLADDLIKKIAKQQTTPESDGRSNVIPHSLDDLDREMRGPGQGHKRSFFRKKSAAGIKSVTSSQSITDEYPEQWTISAGAPLGLLMSHTSSPSLLKVSRSVSPRLSITDEDALAVAQSKQKAKFPFVNWLKGEKGDKITTDLVEMRDSGVNGHMMPLDKIADNLIRRPSGHQHHKTSLTFMRGAKKRVEDQFSKLVFGKGKNKQSHMDEHIEMSRRSSMEYIQTFREGRMIPLKETRLVSVPLLRAGMLRFSFLIESCSPGSLPDPPLLAAVLDLKAPVAARAAFYIECAHFVHACNRGQWPSWMKLNIPMLRPAGPGKSLPTARRGTMSHALYRTAGRMFYQWAEAIGARIEDMELKAEKPLNINLDDNRKRCLRLDDEEEDFLNEASVNPNGNDCPFALKMAATQVLLEITTFLRESHQYLPTRSSRASVSNPKAGDKMSGGVEARAITANRRWSMALSSLGFSQNSAHSLMSLADGHPQLQPPGERRISFVLHEADGEVNSLHSSVGSKLDQEPRHEKRMSQANISPSVSGPNRPHLLRRATGGGQSNGSFKRRSLKLKKGERRGRNRSATIDDTEDANLTLGPNSIMKRADSMRSRGRRVSGISERSDVSGAISGEESPGVLSDDGQVVESTTDNLNADDSEIVKSFPWIKVVVGLMNGLDFECQHHHFCHPRCYKRQVRSCRRLVHAIKQVYKPEPEVQEKAARVEDKEELAKKEKRFKKMVTGTGPSSPIRRKISVGHNIDKTIEKDHHASHHSSMTAINQIDVETGLSEDLKKHMHDTPKVQRPEDPPSLKYVKNQVKDLFHNPLSMMLKATLVLQPNYFIEQLILAWEMLLDDDQHLASVAASAFIVASVKCPDVASELLSKELQSEDSAERIKAVTKFYCIWRARHMCWPRMEEGAQHSFKVPPAGIEFTLPSPKIALDTMPVADPPWMLTIKGKVEEVTIGIGQEQAIQKSIVTATKTRRKQKIEMIQQAIEQEQEKMRDERESFRISAVPANMQASYEPALFLSVDETTGNDQGDDQADERPEARPHVQVAQTMFPSCLCSASLIIINLLDDASVSSSGSAVYEVAYKVIWHCLVEDTALFLRHFFEKITREKQKEIFQILRRLIRFMPRLPAQAAYTLYNYLIGFVMFNVRTPNEGNHELVGAILSVLWLVVPSVHGLFLKDLKQILRKEQCDANLLITANVPSAKKIIVYGPEVGGIPSQFPIQEDTQFYQILVDSLDFFGIDDSLIKEYYLLDAKTNEIHNLNAFVRDFYFFKRSQYPQLSLVRLNPTKAFEKLQKQAFNLQFVEVGKALMSLAIVKSNYLSIQRVLFLHEELIKLPSFPRKALEAHFSLYKGAMGKNMLGMDTLHKIVWIRLVARMFEVTSGFFAQSSDIHLFVNVLNGALILHCEDAAVLRICMATYINVAHQFKNIFAINGYLMIMPTLLRIYSNHQSNGLLCKTIEFVCKQFYIMHRKPFLCMLCGSAAPILDTDTTSNIGDAAKIQPLAFFKLLQSLAQYISDPLDILDLVEFEKPLKALDFCYQMDPEIITILDTISLCVTVVSYSADCMRSHQMLTILEAIFPLYMKHLQATTLKKETPGGPRAELQMIHNLSHCIRTLISNCEPLARNFSGPQRAIDLRGSSMKNTKGQMSPPIEIDDDSHSKYIPDTYTTPGRSRQNASSGDEDNEEIRQNFRRPRDTLLNLVSEFLTRSTARLADLSKKVPDLHQKGSSYELLDVKSHLRLAEVAHSLLKVAPYDRQTMGCRGLIRYMTEVLPTSEWRQEKMRPALIVILRRLDKMFAKIAKKNVMKRATDWEAAKRLLKGVYLTFTRHPYIVHLPHLKSLITVTQTIVLGDMSQSGDASASLPQWAAAATPPAGFSSVAVRLIAMQMLQMGESQTLEIICGTNLSHEKAEVYLMNLIYPMAIRISGGLKDVPKFRLCDVSFTLTVILNALNPSASKSMASKAGGSDSNSCPGSQSSIHLIGFLGLKILMVCYERLLAGEWNKIARCVREMCSRNTGGITMWNFLDFVVSFRTPLFVLLMPMIRCKILQRICSTDQEYYYQQQIKQKLVGQRLPSSRCKGQLLVYLLSEMKQLREDVVNKKYGPGEKKVTNAEQSLSHRLSFAITSAFQAGAKGSAALSSPQGSTPVDPNSPLEKGPAPLARVFSFRDRTTLPIRGLSVKLPMHRDGRKMMDRSTRRTSYPYNVDEAATIKGKTCPFLRQVLILQSFSEGEPVDGNQQTSSEPRLFRKSTLLIKMRNSKRGTAATVSPASPEDSSLTETIEEAGEDSTKELSREDDASAEDSEERNKHKLQRQKAQSRSRFRRSRKTKGEPLLSELSGDAKSRLSLHEDEHSPDETSQLLSNEESGKRADVTTEPHEPNK